MTEDRQLKNHRNREMRKERVGEAASPELDCCLGRSLLPYADTSLAPVQLIWAVTALTKGLGWVLCQSRSGAPSSKRGGEAWQRQEGAVSVLSAEPVPASTVGYVFSPACTKLHFFRCVFYLFVCFPNP